MAMKYIIGMPSSQNTHGIQVLWLPHHLQHVPHPQISGEVQFLEHLD